MRTYRIVFMGTPDFAVPVLRALLDGPDEVVAVATQPDRPKGRGRHLQPPPVKVLAEARGVEVLQPERVKGERGAAFRARLAELAPDLVVVAAYGRILPKALLELPPEGCVNVHASLLPRWRGAGPIQWAVAAGDAESGISIMQMEEGLDTGPVLLQKRLTLAEDETGGSLHDRLAELGADALREALDVMRRGEAAWTPQDDAASTYAPMLKKEDGRLDFTSPAVDLERRVRAFQPWPGTFTELAGRPVKVLRAEALAGEGTAGTVVAAGPAGIDVACGEGVLRLLELQPEGRRPMPAAAFLAGHPLEAGARAGAAS